MQIPEAEDKAFSWGGPRAGALPQQVSLGLAYGDPARVKEGPLEVTIAIEKTPPKLQLVRDLPRESQTIGGLGGLTSFQRWSDPIEEEAYGRVTIRLVLRSAEKRRLCLSPENRSFRVTLV